MASADDYRRVDFSRGPVSREAEQFGPYPGPDIVPPETRSDAQFSSNTNGDPEALLNSTRSSVQAHADLNACYGLTQPVATLGSHPWLRDTLADATTSEPAPAEPDKVRGVPMQREAPNK